jgi:hypothetical protein
LKQTILSVPVDYILFDWNRHLSNVQYKSRRLNCMLSQTSYLVCYESVLPRPYKASSCSAFNCASLFCLRLAPLEAESTWTFSIMVSIPGIVRCSLL